MLISRTGAGRGRKGGALGALLMMTTALTDVVLVQPAHAQSSTAVTVRAFDIPAQPLGRALTDFGRQSGLEVSVDAAAIRGIQSPGVRGEAAPMQALGRLLNGTGFTYRLDGQVVALERAPEASDGAIMLGAVRVQGATGQGGVAGVGADTGVAPSDAPYRTAGSSAYISQEAIQRNRGVSTGDFLSGTPGVINGDNRNSGALDVNIRGMQGMDRVPVVIDGSLQQSTVYRGYAGVAGRTYLDPDLVGAVTIEKGPSASADGVGATGGVVRVETIGVKDLVAPDGRFGMQARVGFTGNTASPPPVATPGTGNGTAARFDRPDALDFSDGQSFSLALGGRFEKFDLVAAYAHRELGNYFGGEHGEIPPGGTGVLGNVLQRYNHGEEVLSTSQDNTSYLLRAVIRPTDEQALDLSYMRYESDFGEMMPSQIIRFGGALQAPLSRTEVDTYTARYRYKPHDSRLIDLRADAWATSNFTSIETLYRYSWTTTPQDVAYMSQSDRWGLNLSNTSSFDTPVGALAVNYGASYTREDLTPPAGWEDYKNNSGYTAFVEPRSGWRNEYSAFVAGELKPWDWMSLNAALRYTETESHDDNLTQTWGTDSVPVTGYNDESNSGVAPILSVLVEAAPGLQVYARYAEAIRAPSLFESTTGFSFYPDPNYPVRPEHVRNLEFGVNYQRDSVFLGGDVLQTKFAVFSNHVDDYLSRGVSDSGVVSVVNIDRAELQGLELNLRYDAGRFFAELGATAYTQTQFCDTEGLCASGNTINSYIPAAIPPDETASLTLGARLMDEKLTLGARYNHVGDRSPTFNTFGGSMTVVEWEPYDLLDLWAAYRINDHISLDLGVDNVTDQYYMDALTLGLMPSPGRTVRFSLTSKFGGPREANSLSRRTGSVGSVLNSVAAWSEFNGDWSGPRLGLTFGQEWLKSQGEATYGDGSAGEIPASESADMDAADLRIGLLAGYDWQVGDRWVVGVEADGQWGQAKTSQYAESTEAQVLYYSDGTPYYPYYSRLQAGTTYDFDWTASLRARVGYAVGRSLFFASTGPAWMRETQTRTQYRDTASASNLGPTQPVGSFTDPSFVEKVKEIRSGWTIGAGAEIALNDRWSIRGEYFYTWFGKRDFDFNQARGGVGNTFDYQEAVGTEWVDWSTDPEMSWICDIDASLCTPFEQFVYETRTYDGSYDQVTGRKARNDADLHTLRIGLTYRF